MRIDWLGSGDAENARKENAGLEPGHQQVWHYKYGTTEMNIGLQSDEETGKKKLN